MNTKNRAWRFVVLSFATLMPMTQVRAETQTVGALQNRGRLLVVDGELQAKNANGTLRWKLSRREAGLSASPEDNNFSLSLGEVVLSRGGGLVALSGTHQAQVRETLSGKLKFNAPFWNPYTKLSLPLEQVSRAPHFAFASWQSEFQFATLPGPQQVIRAMSFSPDGKRLAVGGWQTIEYSNADGSSRNYKTQGRVRVFDTANGRISKTFEIADMRVYNLRWTSRTRVVAQCGDNRNRAFVVSSARR